MLSAGPTVHEVYIVGLWYALPVVSVVCLVLGILWRARLHAWLLLVAAVPSLAWAVLSLYMRAHDSGVNLIIEAVVFTWSIISLAALASAAVFVRGQWRGATGVALAALAIPVPLMVLLLLLSVVNRIIHS